MSNPTFHFVGGTDDFFVSRRASEAFRDLSEGVEDEFAREIIDGSVRNADELEEAVGQFLAAVQTLPMFGGEKAVWFKNVNFLGDTITGKSEAAKQQMALVRETMESVDPASVRVLISASPLDKRRSEVKWILANSNCEVIESKNEGSVLLPLIMEEARKYGIQFSSNALEMMLMKINYNSRLAVEETRKLAAYLGENGGTVEEEHINEMVPIFGEGDFFEASEALFALNLPWALNAINRHFFEGKDARPLLSSIQSRIRLVLQLRALMDARMLGPRLSKGSLQALAGEFSGYFEDDSTKSPHNIFTQNPWYLSRLMDSAKNISLKRLIDWQELCIHAFQQIVDRPADQQQIMNTVAVKAIS